MSDTLMPRASSKISTIEIMNNLAAESFDISHE